MCVHASNNKPGQDPGWWRRTSRPSPPSCGSGSPAGVRIVQYHQNAFEWSRQSAKSIIDTRLLDFGGVNVLGPAALNVVDALALGLKPLRVHLGTVSTDGGKCMQNTSCSENSLDACTPVSTGLRATYWSRNLGSAASQRRARDAGTPTWLHVGNDLGWSVGEEALAPKVPPLALVHIHNLHRSCCAASARRQLPALARRIAPSMNSHISGGAAGPGAGTPASRAESRVGFATVGRGVEQQSMARTIRNHTPRQLASA